MDHGGAIKTTPVGTDSAALKSRGQMGPLIVAGDEPARATVSPASALGLTPPVQPAPPADDAKRIRPAQKKKTLPSPAPFVTLGRPG
jgi:hypothetical protein